MAAVTVQAFSIIHYWGCTPVAYVLFSLFITSQCPCSI